jgi:SPP1 family predicted phage head-tail adaptor
MADFLKRESFKPGEEKKRSQIGNMRHRISFRTFTESQGSDGSLARTWTTETEQWGRVEFTTAQSEESFEGEQVVHRLAMTLVVRYRNDIRPKHRVLHEGIEYDIISVLADPMRVYLTIEAIQRESQWASFSG